MFVKICGMTRQADLDCAREAGCAMAGFIFAGKSPRRIAPAAAARLMAGGMLRVGVFTQDDAEAILQVMKEARLDLAQLHGGQSRETAQAIGKDRVLRVVWPERHAEAASLQAALDEAAEEAAGVLLDAGKSGGGSGLAFDRARLAGLRLPSLWMLAGGLGPETPAELAAGGLPLPCGLDFNSGLEEAPGRKSKEAVFRAMAGLRALGLGPDPLPPALAPLALRRKGF